IISKFSVVIAARLHANIIAYSLDIPSIGLVWNDKLTFFGNKIGVPERFIPTEHLSAENIIRAALHAESEGFDKHQRASYQAQARLHIQQLANRFMADQL